MVFLKRTVLMLLILGTTCSGLVLSAEPIGGDTETAMQTIGEQLLFAKTDLAHRLDVNPDNLEVETVRQVHWRDGAVGCPSPGMTYSQAIISGVLIRLRADDHVYLYHARNGEAPSFCPADRAEPPALGQGVEAM